MLSLAPLACIDSDSSVLYIKLPYSAVSALAATAQWYEEVPLRPTNPVYGRPTVTTAVWPFTKGN